MVEYAKHLRSEFTSIESKTFIVRSQEVKFEIKLIPANMKWLSKFSGELNNAATYPCPFANVKKDELKWSLFGKWTRAQMATLVIQV